MRTNIPFLTLISFLFIVNVHAQEFCGTQMTPAYEHHLVTKSRAHLYSASRSVDSLLVPVQYHIIGQNDGSGYFTTSELVSLHCALNDAFETTNIQFYFDREPQYINNSNYYNFQDFNSGSSMMNEHNVSNVCNIYIVENPAGVCGYAYYPGSGPNGGGIVLNKDCSSFQSTTLPHEMGHYLGLPHTFSNFGSNVEFVDGSNCGVAGDLFCDTPADFLDYRWNCPYTGSETDPKGDLYSSVIDQTLYMSYSMDECQQRFSAMQEVDMYHNLQNERPYLLNQADQPEEVELESIEVLKKAYIDYMMPAKQAHFTWNSVPGAFMYHFQLTRHALSFTYDYDILVSDTSLMFSDLLTNTNYRWRVKPISRINTCLPFSDYQYIKTSKIDVDFEKIRPGCSGNTDGFIKAIPVSGTAPFSFQWSNGVGINPLTSLPGGTYYLTVTDGDNEKTVLEVDLAEPNELEVDININEAGLATAMATGGTPPYIYQWGDGTLGSSNNSVQPGNLVAYVTDDNGCVSSKLTVVASAQGPSTPQSFIDVYPNPVQTGDQLIIGLTSKQAAKGLFELFGSNGRLIRSIEVSLHAGAQNLTLNTNGLSDGVYILKVISPEHRHVERLVISQ